MNKKGLSPLIAGILIIGTVIVLAILVIIWISETIEPKEIEEQNQEYYTLRANLTEHSNLTIILDDLCPNGAKGYFNITDGELKSHIKCLGGQDE